MPAKTTAKRKPKTAKVTKKADKPVEVEIVETKSLIPNQPVLPAEIDEEMSQAKRTTGPEKYYEAVGRRKVATARVRAYTKKSVDIQPADDKAIISVNGKPYSEYFNDPRLQEIVDAPLRKLKSLNRFKASVKVQGGGMHGQADAIKFGLSRALVLFDPNFAKRLRKAGYLTRDSREKERRKYGLKKARKSPQWAKR